MRPRWLNQPIDGEESQLGHLITRLLRNDPSFSEFTLAVAYAKRSGVARIWDALREFKGTGGTIRAVIGVDQRGTSRQALELFSEVADALYVFHDASRSRTFHPKVYLFSSPSWAVFIVGSGNLTQGGLFTNYEAATVMELDLAQEPDREFLAAVRAQLEQFLKESETSIQVDERLIDELERLGYLANEDVEEQVNSRRAANGESTGPFRARSGLPGAPTPDIAVPADVTEERDEAISEEPAPADGSAGIIAGFWKKLSTFDVSLTSAPGQIQIPQAFEEWFPPVSMTKGPDKGGKGRQWETHLSVIFIDGDDTIEVPDARFIIYEPRTGHPRPNIERRFTFRSRAILERLTAGDVLEFRRTSRSQPWFEVRRLPAGSEPHLTERRFGPLGG